MTNVYVYDQKTGKTIKKPDDTYGLQDKSYAKRQQIHKRRRRRKSKRRKLEQLINDGVIQVTDPMARPSSPIQKQWQDNANKPGRQVGDERTRSDDTSQVSGGLTQEQINQLPNEARVAVELELARRAAHAEQKRLRNHNGDCPCRVCINARKHKVKDAKLNEK